MQISFDPLNPVEREAVAEFLDAMVNAGNEGLGLSTLASTNVDTRLTPESVVALKAAIEGEAQDTRDAAAVFGAVSAAPLALAPSTAVAGLSVIAPEASPALLPLQPVAAQPLAPVAPPLAAAPSAPAGQTSPAGAVPLDSTGLPWDARIHAGNKATNKDGTWRAKRGLNDGAMVKRVEDELRAVMALPAGAATPAPAAAPLRLLQPATPAAEPAIPVDFDMMMPRITRQVNAAAMPADALLVACQAHGLPGIVALTARPDYVAVIWAYLQAQYPALV